MTDVVAVRSNDDIDPTDMAAVAASGSIATSGEVDPTDAFPLIPTNDDVAATLCVVLPADMVPVDDITELVAEMEIDTLPSDMVPTAGTTASLTEFPQVLFPQPPAPQPTPPMRRSAMTYSYAIRIIALLASAAGNTIVSVPPVTVCVPPKSITQIAAFDSVLL
jgi:hypothetical protein